MDSPLTIIVTIVTSVGFGAAVKSIVDGVIMARRGVSGREDRRRADIIAARDHAIALQLAAEAGERAADERADQEMWKRIAWREEAARLRLRVIALGGDPGPWSGENTDYPPSTDPRRSS